MTAETKNSAPLTRAERTVRIIFWLSLIAAFAVISSCVLLLECLHDEERRIEMNRNPDSDSAGTVPLPIPIILLYFSVVCAIATIIIWLAALVLVRYFGKSAPLIGRPPAEVVSGSVPPTETPVPLEITPPEPDSKQKP